MLRVHFTAEDLTRTRILPDPDPLWEMVFSRFRMHERHGSPVYRQWLRTMGTTSPARTGRLRAGCAVLATLAPLGPYFPDFLTPPEGAEGVDAGLEALRRTSRRELRGQLERLARTRSRFPAWVRPLADGDATAVRRLAMVLDDYHAAAITPHAAPVRRSVAADHTYRLHTLATGGLDGLLASLRPTMRWCPPVLEVDYEVDRDLYLRGRGLSLVPSYFCSGAPVSLADPELPPVIVYPIGQEFHWQAVRGPGPLEALLGRTRSAVLHTLDGGLTTTQIARRLDVSLASASRHAAVLRDAGLITSHRDRSSMLHSLTPLGLAMLDHGE